MGNQLISVIVPVYNVEEYLKQCLDSILEQTFSNYEVILVNDAHKTNGFIGEISAMISESEAFDFLDSPIVRLASEDVPVPYNHTLETAIVPSVEKIINAIYKVMNKQ